MKNRFKSIFKIILASLLALVMLSGCGDTGSSNNNDDDNKDKNGNSAGSQSDEMVTVWLISEIKHFYGSELDSQDIFAYDSKGNMIEYKVQAFYDGETIQRMHLRSANEYDANGNVTKYNSYSQGELDEGYYITYTYDENNFVTEIKDYSDGELYGVSTFKHENNRFVEIKIDSEMGSHTKYIYDSKGNLKEEHDCYMETGEVEYVDKHNLKYDSEGRMIEDCDENGGRLVYTYNDKDLITKRIYYRSNGELSDHIIEYSYISVTVPKKRVAALEAMTHRFMFLN
jgi:hypothetical protein